MFEVVVCNAVSSADASRELRRFDLSRLNESGQRVVIGRAEDCDIRIKSPAISRHHCAVEIDEGDWIIRDLGSTHGVEVEGVKVSEAAIVPGLEVVIGPAVLRFHSAAARVAAEIARELGEDGSGRR